MPTGIPELTAQVVNCSRPWIRRAAVQEKEGLASGQSTETGLAVRHAFRPGIFALQQSVIRVYSPVSLPVNPPLRRILF